MNQFDDVADDIVNELNSDSKTEAQSSKQLTEALLRVEMSNLYIHLVKNNYFQPGSAHKTVLDKVNKEVQEFAMERLQTLLGIKQTPEQVAQSSTFSPNETAALKALSAAVLSKKEAPKTKLGENRPTSTAVAPVAAPRKIQSTAPVMAVSDDSDDSEQEEVSTEPSAPPRSNMTSEERLRARKKIKPVVIPGLTGKDKLKSMRIGAEVPLVANISGAESHSGNGMGLNDLVSGALND